jgi:hypothetical protein
MAQDWYIVRNGKEHGPYSPSQLKQLAASGKLQPDDKVRREDMETACKASSLKGLFPETEAVAVEPRKAKAPPRAKPAEPDEPLATKKGSSSKNVAIIVAAIGGCFLLCCGSCGVMVFFGDRLQKQAHADLTEADGLWDKGDRAAAVSKYRSLMSNDYLAKERPTIYGRVIDFEYEQGHADAAKALIEQADKAGITPVVSRQEAKAVLASIEADKKEKERKVAEAKAKEGRKKSKYPRDEFRALVMHQTKAELLDLLGKPSDTQDVQGLGEYWYYDRKTFDPVTDKTDFRAQLTIQGGRVTGVNFF